MKHFFTFVISACHIVVFGQSIQNGGFEDGPHVNYFSQIYRATHWFNGCEFNTDLYDCQAQPVPSGPDAGSIYCSVPVNCLYPRNNGSTNCRFGSLRTFGLNNSGSGTVSAGHLRNELSSDLLPNVNYELKLWVARSQGNNYPPTRRIEAVLRATTDGDICDNAIIIPISIDIPFTNCNWMLISTSFQLTPTQAAGGYDWIEFREISRPGYTQEHIYIDDVELNGTVMGLSESLSSETVNIYPVPTSSNLHIDTKFPYQKIILTDLMGKVLLEEADSKTISVETLSNGVYIIQLVNGEEIYSQRIVKQ